MVYRTADARRLSWEARPLPSLAVAAVLLLAGPSLVGLTGCAEIRPATTEEANKLTELRADLEREHALVAYQKKRKDEAAAKGEDPDQYDDAAALSKEPRFAEFWRRARTQWYDENKDTAAKLSADIVNKCTVLAAQTKKAEEVNACIKETPEAAYNPLTAVGVAALVLALGGAGAALYRSARRRIDPVALAGGKLGLAALQSTKTTTLTGEHKGFAVKVEASAPEIGQGDGFIRVLVLSKVDPHAVVRFGPLAPPTGLDLPDLDAPEVHDSRLPEGYKLRLSPGTDANALLSGDIGFQLRAFDPADVRVHDGMTGLTCWQVPASPDKVVEFIDLAVAVARLYPAA